MFYSLVDSFFLKFHEIHLIEKFDIYHSFNSIKILKVCISSTALLGAAANL